MRIKLDSSTRVLPEAKREEARNDFLKMYDEFPVQVVWIYLKRIRFMKHGGTMIGTGNMLEDYNLPVKYLEGLEDVVVVCSYPFLSRLAAVFVMIADQKSSKKLVSEESLLSDHAPCFLQRSLDSEAQLGPYWRTNS
jgi:hypothetical protein